MSTEILQLIKNLKDVEERFNLKGIEYVREIDGVKYLLAHKITISRKKPKAYVYILKVIPTRGELRIVDIKGFPLDLVEDIVKYGEKVREKLKEILE